MVPFVYLEVGINKGDIGKRIDHAGRYKYLTLVL